MALPTSLEQIRAMQGSTPSASLKQILDQILGNYSELGDLTQNSAEFQTLGGMFDSPQFQEHFGNLQARASGADQPFNDQVVASMIGMETGANARSVQNQDAITRQAMANSGMGGSGLEASQMISARRSASAASRQARSQITSKAHLSNFQARERAQQEIQGYLQQQLQNQQFIAAQKAALQAQATMGQNEALMQMRDIQPAERPTYDRMVPNSNQMQFANSGGSTGHSFAGYQPGGSRGMGAGLNNTYSLGPGSNYSQQSGRGNATQMGGNAQFAGPVELG